MVRLGRGIATAIVEKYGPEEFLRRLSDPVWFQSLGCVLGFDWNSSGLTVVTLGALKEGLFEVQDELGVYVCGGKRVSRNTPQEIEAYGISRGFSFAPKLIYASKMAAKTDSSLVQDNYQIYQHNFLFTRSGQWTVIQQGMNTKNQTARRYHWSSSDLKDFIEEPHTGIISGLKVRPLNLTAKTSGENRDVSLKLVREEANKFIKDIGLIQTKNSSNLREMKLFNKEFYWHPVVEEKFNLKRLEKTIMLAKDQNPKNYQELVSLRGIGPRTIRALSLVSEIIYGAKPSYDDPARYSFAFGGKDSTPYPVERPVYDKVLSIIEKGISDSRISNTEKRYALQRLKIHTKGL